MSDHTMYKIKSPYAPTFVASYRPSGTNGACDFRWGSSSVARLFQRDSALRAALDIEREIVARGSDAVNLQIVPETGGMLIERNGHTSLSALTISQSQDQGVEIMPTATKKITKGAASRKGAKKSASAEGKPQMRKATEAASAEAKPARKHKAADGDAKPKKLSAIDAAAQVLAASKEPMNTKQMIEAMAAKGLWTSPGGKTPAATLYSAILREVNTKGAEARFKKTDRGHFASNA